MAAHTVLSVKKVLLFCCWSAGFLSVAAVPFATAYAASATLTLDPATVNTTVGQTFAVKIQLDTGGEATDGTRLLLNYDKNLLSLSSFTNGTIYTQYPSNSESIDDSTGSAKLTGIADNGPTFTGTGTFATANFTAKAAGTAQISVDFTGVGQTDDSNVADSATQTDILSSVTGTTVTIAAGNAAATPQPTLAPGNTLPNTATVNPTILFVSAGSALVTIGLGILVLL